VFSDDDMYYAPAPFDAFLQRHDHSVAQVMGPATPISPFTVYPAREHCT
jgi:hypothetical protein